MLHTDRHDLATLDVNGMNHYPANASELVIDYNRGTRETVWTLEQHTRLKKVDTLTAACGCGHG